ncbi:MAG: c-type cytochrome domain-containing protein [Verrucomicrobiota bacterium]
MKIPHRFFVLSAVLALPFGNISQAEDSVVYTDIIAPVFEAKCVSCHGADKQKGKLRMDTMDFLTEGGSEGPAIVAGDVDASLAMFRIDLPVDDDEHMPPEDKIQLTDDEVKLLRFWIEKGANPTAKVSQLGLTDDLKGSATTILASLKAQPGKPAPSAEEVKITEAKKKLAAEVMTKVNATGATLMPIAQNTPELRFSALNVAKEYGDAQLKMLEPIADQIAAVDIARTKVSDAGLATIGRMTNLRQLKVEKTNVSDAGLKHLSGLTSLEYLNLYGTQVTDAGLAHLTSLAKLTRLYLWQSKATSEGADKLKKNLPDVIINLGWEHEAKQKAVQVAATKPAAKPVPAQTPKPAPKPAAPKPAAKPAPAPATPAPAATATAGITLAVLESHLKAAHDEASRLNSTASKALTDAKAAAAAASANLDKVKKDAAAKQKAAELAKGQIKDREAAVKAIQGALDTTKTQQALAALSKRLEADLKEAQKLLTDGKNAVTAADAAAKGATAAIAAAEKTAAAKAQAVDQASKQVAKVEAIAKSITAAVTASKG